MKVDKKKVLFVGPMMPPITGQSIAFTRLVQGLEISQDDIIDTNQESSSSVKKAFSSVVIMFLTLWKILSGNYGKVYFTCSRTFMGSLKDVVLINVASRKGLRVINHLHGSDFYDFLHSSSPIYRSILVKSYHKVHVSIVLIDRMKSQFEGFDNMKIEVVNNFFDQEVQTKPVESNPDVVNSREIRLLYLSNIIMSKGILDLLKAFDILCETRNNIDLYIAGSFMGDDYLSSNEVQLEFYEMISKNSRIHYEGIVLGAKKNNLFCESDIFVLPSYYKSEAFPISIVEAMAFGNAIVTTNHRYLPDIISSKNGAVVNVRSPNEIANEIEFLISNPKVLMRIKENNVIEAKDNYGFSKYISSLSKIISS